MFSNKKTRFIGWTEQKPVGFNSPINLVHLYKYCTDQFCYIILVERGLSPRLKPRSLQPSIKGQIHPEIPETEEELIIDCGETSLSAVSAEELECSE